MSVGVYSSSSDDSLRKHAYSNVLKISPPITENFQIQKQIWSFSYFCTKHRLWVLVRTASPSSNAYLHSKVLSRNRKNNVYPCKPQFYIASVWKHFCNTIYRNQNFTVTVCIDLEKIVGKSNFSEQFRKRNRYKRTGYSLDSMR